MNKEDLQQIADLLNPKFENIDSKFDKIDSKFDKIDSKFDKLDEHMGTLENGMTKLDERMRTLENGMIKLDRRVDNLEQWQDRIINDISDFRQEVKEDQEYTHRRIDQGFINISEQMAHSFANERRIKHLEWKGY